MNIYGFVDVRITVFSGTLVKARFKLQTCKQTVSINIQQTSRVQSHSELVRLFFNYFLPFFATIMAHLNPDVVELRYNSTCDFIIEQWEAQNSTKDTFAIQCLCEIDCNCMSNFEVPRLVLNRWLWVCELNLIYLCQPFFHLHGFDIIWH